MEMENILYKMVNLEWGYGKMGSGLGGLMGMKRLTEMGNEFVFSRGFVVAVFINIRGLNIVGITCRVSYLERRFRQGTV
jgi:hypothetical protein